MNRQTAEALEASIAHWDANAKAEKPSDATTSVVFCALCDIFYWQLDLCKGCPVSRSTRLDACLGTPCNDARNILHDWKGGESYREAFHKAAIAERDFLISLREPIDEEAAPSTEAP